jgi:hypothetical protein
MSKTTFTDVFFIKLIYSPHQMIFKHVYRSTVWLSSGSDLFFRLRLSSDLSLNYGLSSDLSSDFSVPYEIYTVSSERV